MNMGDIWGAREEGIAPVFRLLSDAEAETVSLPEAVDYLHQRIVLINEMTNDEFGPEQIRDHLRMQINGYRAVCELAYTWWTNRPLQTQKIKSTYRYLQDFHVEDQIAMIRAGKQL